ncbi:Bacteriophage HK97-gp10, putative tail-component [uncultured Caudovirales phage]|uniref:Bacteriophage HK97-gp10, putative tail-component n=1 Tax=uncultured Caudovirales phage TaxID=2100421 RepID=A0A6J5QLC3_9CAUD|nr:Bacteriophage HK97-gp10, putative tail-component [uncultured Caudovirales phage]
MRSGQFFTSFWKQQSTRDCDDLIRAYGELPATLARKHLKAAMRRAIRPFAPALRRSTPKRTGNLRRAITVVVRFSNKISRNYYGNFQGGVTGSVGFKRGAGKGNHSNLVEDGSVERRRVNFRGEKFGKNKGGTGKMPARHMLRETLDARKDGILQNLELEMGVSLERAARELAKRGRH